MARWAALPMDRQQTVLFHPTLDAMIDEDHPVRLFEEILAAQDWSGWEARYDQHVGQPPIHPRILAGALLYGLSHGLRSSRRLEWACRNALDFLWLVQGLDIDHSTFCEFRTRFGSELKGLFRQIGRLAITMGLVRLNQMALDGTKIQANASRHATATAATIQERLEALDRQIEKMFAEAQQVDQQDGDLFGQSVSANHLPRALADLRKRQEQLRKALGTARQEEADRPEGSRVPKVPVADPDSRVLPNKQGGHAPNYLPMAAVDGHKGYILEAEVLAEPDEAAATVPTLDRIEREYGQRPGQVLADGSHPTGPNLAGLAERGVEAYMPLAQREDRADNPAHRADPSQAVPAERWAQLPRNSRTGKLDRAAFVYDGVQDCYFCPQGQGLVFVHHCNKGAGRDVYRVYQTKACPGCALAGECLSKEAKYRTISRDEHEPLREALEQRMGTAEGQAIYRRRRWLAETPFAWIKGGLGLRQFLLRGLGKVDTEWQWACMAFNLKKLVGEVGRLRRWVVEALQAAEAMAVKGAGG